MSKLLSIAVDAAGGPDAFRKALNISPRTLAEWKRRGVPDTQCVAVERVADGAVRAEELGAERVTLLRDRITQVGPGVAA
jgi:DNA-binding transcriptional regulator YdaS (Cro superfamily)